MSVSKILHRNKDFLVEVVNYSTKRSLVSVVADRNDLIMMDGRDQGYLGRSI